MRVGYIGNFGPRHSTENHIAQAVEALGHTVERYQENHDRTWDEYVPRSNADVILWTHTGGFPPEPSRQEAAIGAYRATGRRVLGVHLDRWWGLAREDQITVERKPFFHAVDRLYTADGGHQWLWEREGIDHVWFPPAVSERETAIHEPMPDRFGCDVAFVGSWQGGYHPEWRHRHDLILHLRRWAERRPTRLVRFFPEEGQAGLRGRALRALYNTATVVVGDSCLVPRRTQDGAVEPMVNYCSDRVPETIGRGGYLLHPYVEGVTGMESGEALYRSSVHLRTWPLGDWAALTRALDWATDPDPEVREAIDGLRMVGREHVVTHHTYEARMRRLFDLEAAPSLVTDHDALARRARG